jgi:hypothetical protein
VAGYATLQLFATLKRLDTLLTIVTRLTINLPSTSSISIMPSRKRLLAAIDGDDGENGHSMQYRIRNMWQFANLCQWIYIFGKAAKIDEAIDVEV